MKILVCLDGEPHTRDAVERAIALTRAESAELVGLHVIDEWLRQFSSEIYAQGRKEYLEWVDRCLEEKACLVRESFAAQCHAHEITARFVLRDGDPLVEIVAAARELAPDFVLVGGKPLRGLQRLRSGKLAERLAGKLGPAVQIVAGEAGPQRVSSAAQLGRTPYP